MKKTVITNNFSETQNIGFEFAKTLKGGEIIALYGDLGSGKTTFTQGLAKGLGIDTRIISPTFIIMRSYQIGIKNHESRIMNFFHIDLYRIESERDVEGLGLMEIMGDPENIVVIEWPEKLASLLPEKRIDILFKYFEDEKREIIFE